VSSGRLTNDAVKAVQKKLSKLFEKQRLLFKLTKDDICTFDYSEVLVGTRIYLMKERMENGELLLDYYVQCLMQYKKSQSCSVNDGWRGKTYFREISLPKDYGFSMPRPVYITLRLTQQLKPEKSEDLVITAFNFIAIP
jgi:hypothetical protein